VWSSCRVWRPFLSGTAPDADSSRLDRLYDQIRHISATTMPARRQQRLDGHDVHDAREVVGQYVQGPSRRQPVAASSSGSGSRPSSATTLMVDFLPRWSMGFPKDFAHHSARTGSTPL